MKNIKWLALVLCVVFVISKAHLISYLLMQGQGQLEVLWNAQPIEEFLTNPSVDEELKSKIKLVDEVKEFAETELGLAAEGLYTSIYDQHDEDILWNVTACHPYMLKSVEWSFPIVGSVSYKGFFDLEKAKHEASVLADEGYDVRIRPVNAWSTLGWFPDPILSNNLKRSEGSLAELFIHEITHSNIFLKDSVTFNENLASFIGEAGALMFLESRFGSNSPEVQAYVQFESDTQTFVRHCLKGVSELDSLYRSFSSEMDESNKQKLKEQYIRSWVERLDVLSFYDENSYQGKFKDELPNNAFFMAFDRYDSKKEFFADQLNEEFEGDLSAFIEFYKGQN